MAVTVAAARQARAAILAMPFDSFLALAEKRYPHLPLGWLVDGRFDSAALAPAVSAPALFVLAELDDVTPVEHGRALAAAWAAARETVLLRGATHTGIRGGTSFGVRSGTTWWRYARRLSRARAPLCPLFSSAMARGRAS